MIIKLEDLRPRVSEDAWVASNAVVVGDVEIKKDSSIWYSATIRADADKISIGEGVSVQDNAVIHVTKDLQVEIGNHTTIGHNAILHGCKIGENVVVGMGAIILNGAKIGDNCIIGAGSLVTENKEIPANSLAFGNPARVIRQLTPDEVETNKKIAKIYIEESRKYKSDSEIMD